MLLIASIALLGRPLLASSNGNLDEAAHLYQAGKFAEAEAKYGAIVKANAGATDARVGLVRSLLREDKIDDAWQVLDAGLQLQPPSASLLAVKGEVLFRRGEMAAAELALIAAIRQDPREYHARLQLAQLYRAYSYYRKAYDEIRIAHDIAPDATEVQAAWLGMLPRKQRLAALEAYLAGPHPDTEEETIHLQDYLEFLKQTVGEPVHRCKLVSQVESTELKLVPMLSDSQRQLLRGFGLDISLNGHNARLQLDTGAGGIFVGRKTAEKAGLTRLAAEHYSGMGDKGAQRGYSAVVKELRIGALTFEDCLVSVSDSSSVRVMTV